MKYRAEIDGLRALAVVPVILFHAGFKLFSGGYVGVDVFFVISGYLITTIIVDDIENKRFSITNFYERRARRILPALVFVMLGCIPLAWMLLIDARLVDFGNSLISVSLFISNVNFWINQGYFVESAALNPLIHTWSLAVEEQYYFLFPVFLIFAWRFGHNSVFWTIVVMAVVSLLVSEWGWRNKPTANFYLAPTRAWELFAGSISALIVQKKGVQANNILASVGLLAIVFAIFFYDESIPFPSVYALVPVLGVVLLILFAKKETLVARLLSAKVLIGIGLISYSAYLWHQPVFAYTRIFTNQISISYELRYLLTLITFGLAYLSWRYIEKPFRNQSSFSRSTIFLMTFASVLTLSLAGFASKKVALKSNEYSVAKNLSENDFVYFSNMNEKKFIVGRLIYPLNEVNHIAVGSSRIMQVSSEVVGEPILNLAVSGASIKDSIAILPEAVAKLNAKNVYIGADPWMLNMHLGQNNYKLFASLYSYWLERISSQMPLQTYLSSKQLGVDNTSSIKILSMLRNKLQQTNHLIPKNGEPEGYDKRAYDGFHIYNDSYANNKNNINKDLLNYGMEKFEYAPKVEKSLQLLVSYLKRFDVKITLVLSPYHPDLYRLMRSDRPIFLEIENKFKEFSHQHDIEIIGSYDPSIVGCTSDEFYDGMHPKKSCLNKVFNSFK